MSPSAVRVVSTIALAAVLLGAREARAQQNSGEDLAILATTAGPPSAVLLVLDTAMLISLAGDGTSRRGLGVNGLIFSGINGLMTLSALSAGAGVRAGGSRSYVPLCFAALALSVASGALSIYALLHPPAAVKPPPGPPQAPERSPSRPSARPPSTRPAGPQLDSDPSFQLLPYWDLSPAGSLSGGGVLSLRW